MARLPPTKNKSNLSQQRQKDLLLKEKKKAAEDDRKPAARPKNSPVAQAASLKALVNTIPNATTGISGNTTRRPESPPRPKDPPLAEEETKLPAVPNTAVAQTGHQLTSAYGGGERNSFCQPGHVSTSVFGGGERISFSQPGNQLTSTTFAGLSRGVSQHGNQLTNSAFGGGKKPGHQLTSRIQIRGGPQLTNNYGYKMTNQRSTRNYDTSVSQHGHNLTSSDFGGERTRYTNPGHQLTSGIHNHRNFSQRGSHELTKDYGYEMTNQRLGYETTNQRRSWNNDSYVNHSENNDHGSKRNHENVMGRKWNMKKRTKHSHLSSEHGPSHGSTRNHRNSARYDSNYESFSNQLTNFNRSYGHHSRRDYFKKPIRFETMYNFKHCIVGQHEPRIFFNKEMRQIFMRQYLIDHNCNHNIRRDIREKWKRISFEMHEMIDDYLSSKPNEMSYHYEDDFLASDLTGQEGFFKTFPYSDHFREVRQPLDTLVSCIKDYVRCRREGMPVIKVPMNLYERVTKHLWSSDQIVDTKQRIEFTDAMKLQRMFYILSEHLVYIDLTPEYRQSWTSYSDTMIIFCNHYCEHLWTNKEYRPDSDSVLYQVQQQMNQFPLNEFCAQYELSLSKHLVDFIFCCHYGIEVEKTWDSEIRIMELDSQTMMQVDHHDVNVQENMNNDNINYQDTNYSSNNYEEESQSSNACKMLNDSSSNDQKLVRMFFSHNNADYCDLFDTIAVSHSIFQNSDRFTKLVSMAWNDYDAHVNTVTSFEQKDIKLIREHGKMVIESLHKFVGFDLGFHVERNFQTINVEAKACCCPFRASSKERAHQYSAETECVFCDTPCDNEDFMTRHELLDHLIDHAFSSGQSLDHLAAFFYVKNVSIPHVDEYREYIEERKYHHGTKTIISNNSSDNFNNKEQVIDYSSSVLSKSITCNNSTNLSTNHKINNNVEVIDLITDDTNNKIDQLSKSVLKKPYGMVYHNTKGSNKYDGVYYPPGIHHVINDDGEHIKICETETTLTVTRYEDNNIHLIHKMMQSLSEKSFLYKNMRLFKSLCGSNTEIHDFMRIHKQKRNKSSGKISQVDEHIFVNPEYIEDIAMFKGEKKCSFSYNLLKQIAKKFELVLDDDLSYEIILLLLSYHLKSKSYDLGGIKFLKENLINETYTTAQLLLSNNACYAFVDNNKRMISEYNNYMYWCNRYSLINGINDDDVNNAEVLSFYRPALSLSLLQSKMILAYHYFDVYFYDIFDGNNIISKRDLALLQIMGRGLMYSLQFFPYLDISMYQKKIGLKRSKKLRTSAYRCFCPLHKDNHVFYDKFLKQRVVPFFLRNDDGYPNIHLRTSSECNDDKIMNIRNFYRHVENKIRTDGCLDHLAIKCYLYAFHGSTLVKVDMTLKNLVKKKIRNKILSFHEKKNSMQLPKNDNSLLTTIKTTSTTIHTSYSSSDDSSMSSVNTCSIQRTEQRVYIDTKFVETFISKNISKQHYEGVQDALLKFVNIVNDNEQEYSILTQKRDKKIDELKRSIFSICKEYTNKGTETDTHVTHAHRFLESLKKNLFGTSVL